MRGSRGTPRARRFPRLLVALAALVAVSGIAFPFAATTVLDDGKLKPVLLLNPPTTQLVLGECPSPGQLRIVLLGAAVHASPDAQSAVLGQASLGDPVCLTEMQAGFGKVRVLDSGTEGWLETKAMPTVAILGLEDVIKGEGVAQALGKGEVLLTELTQLGPAAQSEPVPSASTPPTEGVGGEAGIVVRQALQIMAVTVGGAATGLGLVSDEGAAFTVAVEAFAGSTFFLDFALVNTSGALLNGELQLTVPEGVKVSVSKSAPPDAVTGVGQFGPDTFKFTMVASSNALPDIRVTVKVGLSPGFLTIQGKLKQVAF